MMKQLTALIIVAVLLLLPGCKDNSGTSSNPFGPTGGGSVTFTMSGEGNQSSYEFYFKPSVDVKITQIIAQLPAQSYTDTASNPTPEYVFSKDSSYTWYAYSGIATGQQWNFKFSGSITSNSQAFTETSNFTVP